MTFVPVRRQILPRRIDALDQRRSPRPIPTFNLFLAVDRITDIPERFVTDKPVNTIPLREPIDLAVLVFGHTPQKAVGHAGINVP